MQLHVLETKFGHYLFFDQMVENGNMDIRTIFGKQLKNNMTANLKSAFKHRMDDILHARFMAQSVLRKNHEVEQNKYCRTDASDPYLAEVLTKSYAFAKKQGLFSKHARSDKPFSGLATRTKYCKQCKNHPAIWAKRKSATKKVEYCDYCVAEHNDTDDTTGESMYVNVMSGNGLGFDQGVSRTNVFHGANQAKEVPQFTPEFFQTEAIASARLKEDIDTNYVEGNYMPAVIPNERNRYRKITPTVDSKSKRRDFDWLRLSTVNKNIVYKKRLSYEPLFTKVKLNQCIQQWVDTEAEFLEEKHLLNSARDILSREHTSSKPDKYEYSVLFCNIRKQIFKRDGEPQIQDLGTVRSWSTIADEYFKTSVFQHMKPDNDDETVE